MNQKVLFPAFSTSSFDLVTLLGRNFSFWHVAYGGSFLWIADCILQAGLVFYCTENRWKLFFAIPNTLSSFEPTAFERGRCFAFCFLALICSLQVSANGGNMKTMYVGI